MKNKNKKYLKLLAIRTPCVLPNAGLQGNFQHRYVQFFAKIPWTFSTNVF